MNKILTIIIPTYNMEMYLRRCLDSLIIDEEGMKQLEVLVINDGSKDSSSQIAHEYQDKYPDTYRVIDKENGNYGSCINRGLKEATGKYVKVLDADDKFDTVVFAEYFNYLLSYNADIFVTDVSILNSNGKLTEKWNNNYVPFKLMEISTLSAAWIHNLTYRLDLFNSIDYVQTEGISYTDEEFAFFPIQNAKSFVYLPILLYNYYLGRDGQTMNVDVWKKNFYQEIVVSKKMLEFWRDNQARLHDSTNPMQDKLVNRVNHFFHRTLLEYGMKDIKDIAEFDKYVKTVSPDLYQITTETAIADNRIQFHYLKNWRKHDYKFSNFNMFYISVRLLFLLRKVKKKMYPVICRFFTHLYKKKNVNIENFAGGVIDM